MTEFLAPRGSRQQHAKHQTGEEESENISDLDVHIEHGERAHLGREKVHWFRVPRCFARHLMGRWASLTDHGAGITNLAPFMFKRN